MAPQTGFALLDWFLAALDSWGHLIVFLFTISENLFVIGSFTPGETVVMAAGFTSAVGTLNPWLVGASSLVGTMIGSNVSYWFGRRGGREALLRWGGRVFDEERILAAEEYFERHGNKTILVSRFAAVFKNFAPVLAGVSRMRVWVFELYTLIGAIIYTTLMIALGRIFAENFQRALDVAKGITWFGFVLLLTMVGALLWGRSRFLHRRVQMLASCAEDDSESAEPCDDADADA